MVIGADRFRPDSPETAFAMQIRAAAAHARVDIAGYRDHPEVLEAMAKAARHYDLGVAQFLGQIEVLVHGTTLATNAVLEGKWARTDHDWYSTQ